MAEDDKQTTFPDAVMMMMPSSDSPYPPPSPPPPSPTWSFAPAQRSPSWPPSPSRVPRLSHTPDSARAHSPPNYLTITAAVAAVVPAKLSPSHSRPSSLQSIAKMPPIREHANSIFPGVSTAAHRRSKGGSFYQYGEDYITAYDRVGLVAIPTQGQSPSRDSGARSLCCSASVRSASSARSGRSSKYSAATARRSGRPGGSYKGPCSRGSVGTDGTELTFVGAETRATRGRARDLEKGSVSERATALEKGSTAAGTRARRSWWQRWRRLLAVLLVVLGLAGLAVGIIFGIRAQ